MCFTCSGRSGRLRGGPLSNQPKAPGGSPSKAPKTSGLRGSEACRSKCFTCSGRSGKLICVFYVSGKLRGGPHSNQPKAPGGSPSKALKTSGLRGSEACRSTCFTCSGGSGRLICTYFTCPGGSGGVQPLTNLRHRMGPLLKNLRPEASEALGLA